MFVPLELHHRQMERFTILGGSSPIPRIIWNRTAAFNHINRDIWVLVKWFEIPNFKFCARRSVFYSVACGMRMVNDTETKLWRVATHWNCRNLFAPSIRNRKCKWRPISDSLVENSRWCWPLMWTTTLKWMFFFQAFGSCKRQAGLSVSLLMPYLAIYYFQWCFFFLNCNLFYYILFCKSSRRCYCRLLLSFL